MLGGEFEWQGHKKCNDRKRPNCMLSDANINALCMQFCKVFVLWDGAFSLARTINPTEIDCSTYQDVCQSGGKRQ
jgi:hypothetical protein